MKKLIITLVIAICCCSNIRASELVASVSVDSIVIKVHAIDLLYPISGLPRFYFDSRYKNKYAQYSGYQLLSTKKEISSFLKQINSLISLPPEKIEIRPDDVKDTDIGDPLGVITGKVEIYYKNRIEILWCSNFQIDINNSRYYLSEELKKFFRATPTYYMKPILDKDVILDTVR